MSIKQRNRPGFTLIELVVVIIIIAILAAIAVPKFMDRASDAKEAATMQSLATLRSAIELYRVDTSAYPATLATDIAAYLKGPFPLARIEATESATVNATSSDPITSADVVTGGGWLYNAATGEIRINMATHVGY